MLNKQEEKDQLKKKKKSKEEMDRIKYLKTDKPNMIYSPIAFLHCIKRNNSIDS